MIRREITLDSNTAKVVDTPLEFSGPLKRGLRFFAGNGNWGSSFLGKGY